MSLSYFLTAACAAVSILRIAGNDAGDGAEWKQAQAAVYSERRDLMPKGATQAVELLRFMTAYRQGLEVLVDVTPYSPVMRATADSDGKLSFFTFIDTWVGNNTRSVKHMAVLDNNGKCFERDQTKEAEWSPDGNGWQVDAFLIFWPKKANSVDTRPRESVTISSGYYGSYTIGGITTHEGTVSDDGSSILLDKGTDMTGTLEAEVYPCPGGAKDVMHGVKMGQYARRVLSGQEDVKRIVKEAFQDLIDGTTVVLEVTRETNFKNLKDQQANVNFGIKEKDDKEKYNLTVGMPVWYETDDMQQNGSVGVFPGTHIGTITAVDKVKGFATITIQTGACVPGPATQWLPRLKMEKFAGALEGARKASQSFENLEQRIRERPPEELHDPDDWQSLLSEGEPNQSQDSQPASLHRLRSRKHKQAEKNIFMPYLVARGPEGVETPLQIVGKVDLGFLNNESSDTLADQVSLLQTEDTEVGSLLQTADTEEEVDTRIMDETSSRELHNKGTKMSRTGVAATNKPKAGDKVCVLARRATGQVFARSFHMMSFAPVAKAGSKEDKKTDRALLQFAVTGHGWAGSTDQCGEFCHAIYHLNINGRSVANITTWRSDCKDNPVSDQTGTFKDERDGWCPGSVQPGLFIDVTEWLLKGKNKLSVDLSVWSEKRKKYNTYTNYGNYFGNGDGARLMVGATLLTYDGEAVAAIKKRKAYTAAEKALIDGSSHPAALKPPAEVKQEFAESLLQQSESQFLASRPKMTSLHAKTFKRLRREEKIHKHTALKHVLTRRKDPEVHSEARFDFESLAPWYNFTASDEGKTLGKKITNVTVFVNSIMQNNRREIRATVKKDMIPEEWSSVALHFRLEKPWIEGEELDAWDRFGTFGITFEEDGRSSQEPRNSMVKLHPALPETSSSAGEKHHKLSFL
jgi:hypothetical protein